MFQMERFHYNMKCRTNEGNKLLKTHKKATKTTTTSTKLGKNGRCSGRSECS